MEGGDISPSALHRASTPQAAAPHAKVGASRKPCVFFLFPLSCRGSPTGCNRCTITVWLQEDVFGAANKREGALQRRSANPVLGEGLFVLGKI